MLIQITQIIKYIQVVVGFAVGIFVTMAVVIDKAKEVEDVQISILLAIGTSDLWLINSSNLTRDERSR